MVVLGLILLIIGLVITNNLLVTIGAILVVVGLILNFVPIGGSSRRVFSGLHDTVVARSPSRGPGHDAFAAHSVPRDPNFSSSHSFAEPMRPATSWTTLPRVSWVRSKASP